MRSTRFQRRIVLAALVVVGAITLVTIAFMGVITDYGLDWNLTKAQLGCKRLADAVQAYADHPATTNHELPQTLNGLLLPPWGGESFLKGASELIDPWGNPYQLDKLTLPDGNDTVLIFTVTPVGLPISQYGIGPKTSKVRR